MSTQQILGVVGGVVGSFFGYPQLGFVVGSLVGGLLTPAEKIEGPRVDDLKVQVSTYGAGIPVLYGTERVGGNVVWSTDKIEIEETQGGKGGGPETTTYRYYVHMGIVLCETPRDGSEVSIVQIFQDGKLIYDARSNVPVGSALASEENPHAYFVLYQGHADQLPDPGEEAWMGGPGSVPAYRGVVRIRMNAVECPGGRVPQYSFVLTSTPAVVQQTLMPTTGSVSGFAQADGIWGFETDPSDYKMTIKWVGLSGPSSVVNVVSLGTPYVDFSSPFAVQGAPEAAVMYAIGNFGPPAQDELRLVHLDSGAIELIYTEDYQADRTPIGEGARPHAAFDTSTNSYAVTRGYSPLDVGMTILPAKIECDMSGLNFLSQIAFYDGRVFVLSVDEGIASITVVNSTTGAQMGTTLEPGSPFAEQEGCGISAGPAGVVAFIYQGENCRFYSVAFQGLVSGPISATWLPLAAGVSLLPPGTSPSSGPSSNFFSMANASIIGPNNNGDWTFVRYRTIDLQEVAVSGIISDQCERVGETRFDVSEIPDEDALLGYKLQNPASARSNVDPLLTAFAIYIVDEDGLIKFKKYEDISPVATVSYDELGQAEDGSEAPDAMPLSRAQEVDLPRSVSVSYIEPAFDYQTASEKEVRQITEANEDMIVELPMATTSNHAKKVASMILFARWRSQNTRSFKTSRKYSFVSPGDGLTVEYPRGTFRLWRVTSATDTGVLCEFNVEPGDSELYTQTAVGASGYVGQQVTPLAPPTRLQLLDIPILRDQDSNAGIYAALDNFGPGWTGAELFVGYDDANLASQGSVASDAPIGFAETILGSAKAGLVDEANIFTVNIVNNDFVSVTRDVLLANGAEFWAYGAPGRWEIGASAMGDALGGGRYILSRHLRGLFGTENNAALHEDGDTFVLLRIAGMLRPAMGVGDLGQPQQYRAVSKGRSLNSAPSQTYTNTGEGLRPLSPVNLRRSNANDLSVDRRSRLSMNNSTGTLPLGESSENWEWEFYATSAFTARLGVAYTTVSTVTAAQITGAGAVPSGSLHVRVAQMSDSVGRGHQLQANI